jgi:hypothetical protein
VDDDGEIALDRRLAGHCAIGRKVEHLRRDAGIRRTQQSDVGDALAQHEQSIEPQADRHAAHGRGIEAASCEHLRMRDAALADLDPVVARARVDLPAIRRVGVHRSDAPDLDAGQHRVQDARDHLLEIRGPERGSATDPP